MSLNIDLPARLDELRRDRAVLICDDSIASVAHRYALALGDDPAWHAAMLESLCAPLPHAGETAAVTPSPLVLGYSTSNGWTRIVRRAPPAPVDPRGHAVATHAGPNRAQRRGAR